MPSPQAQAETIFITDALSPDFPQELIGNFGAYVMGWATRPKRLDPPITSVVTLLIAREFDASDVVQYLTEVDFRDCYLVIAGGQGDVAAIEAELQGLTQKFTVRVIPASSVSNLL